MIMMLAGNPVDQQIADLRPALAVNGIILDAGNANFCDTMRTDFVGLRHSSAKKVSRHQSVEHAGGGSSRSLLLGQIVFASGTR